MLNHENVYLSNETHRTVLNEIFWQVFFVSLPQGIDVYEGTISLTMAQYSMTLMLKSWLDALLRGKVLNALLFIALKI